ncbi:MAG: bifunctional hydroxymethylpyrimidine kinase/phosphomethylpyrimidine kinase [Acidimicrobiales bacterium]
MKPPVVLTVAGLDPTGSSGLQADMPTFAALGVHGLSVATVVTAQDSNSVSAFHEIPVDLVRAQLDAVVEDFSPTATKTGMLKSLELVELVESAAENKRLGTLVVDPVMVDSSGAVIVEQSVVRAYRSLAGHATVVTPNRSEAELLAGRSFDEAGDEVVCAAILDLGVPFVVVTGGRGTGDEVEDLVAHSGGLETIVGHRIGTDTIRGTGCTFSAALTASLSSGTGPVQAAANAHEFVREQLLLTDFLTLGSGRPGVPHVTGLDISD